MKASVVIDDDVTANIFVCTVAQQGLMKTAVRFACPACSLPYLDGEHQRLLPAGEGVAGGGAKGHAWERWACGVS